MQERAQRRLHSDPCMSSMLTDSDSDEGVAEFSSQPACHQSPAVPLEEPFKALEISSHEVPLAPPAPRRLAVPPLQLRALGLMHLGRRPSQLPAEAHRNHGEVQLAVLYA